MNQDIPWWDRVLSTADGIVNIYGKYDDIKNPETIPPVPAIENNPQQSIGSQGLSQFGLQASMGVVGVIALIFLLAKK